MVTNNSLKVRNLTPVKSTSIAGLGYSIKSGLLVVQFCTGSVYVYQNISTGFIDTLRWAAENPSKSLGKAFGSIKKIIHSARFETVSEYEKSNFTRVVKVCMDGKPTSVGEFKMMPNVVAAGVSAASGLWF